MFAPCLNLELTAGRCRHVFGRVVQRRLPFVRTRGHGYGKSVEGMA